MPDRQYTLVAVETAHIQSYIYGSNRLKENVGASYLVAAATGQWALEAVRDVCKNHNLDKELRFIDAAQIEDDPNQEAEVLYSGGGNFVVIFASPELAHSFVGELSRHAQIEAPGLTLVFNSQPSFKWDQEKLSHAVSDLLRGLGERRNEQPPLRGVGGQSVTIMGDSTSMPATTMARDPDGNWQMFSSEVAAKRDAAIHANKELQKSLENAGNPLPEQFRFDLELDNLGRSKDEHSYIAVVHADGNGLGILIQSLKHLFPAAGDNREYIEFMRGFSEEIKLVAQMCQQAMIQQVVASIHKDTKGKYYLIGNTAPSSNEKELKFKLQEHSQDKDKVVFPFRPLVSGGDDVTFVCDGRIGIDLAVTFLRQFEMRTEALVEKIRKMAAPRISLMEDQLAADPDENERREIEQGLKKLGQLMDTQHMTACAGIAIVKTHYPFSRAYGLADDLAASAKQARYARNREVSALDWHFTSGGLYGDLEDMRKREYCIDAGRLRNQSEPIETDYASLTLRPLFLTQEGDKLHNWETVQRVARAFQVNWSNNRSKAKRLMDALRKGDMETIVFKTRYLSSERDPKLPTFAGFEKFKENGWYGIYCGYYDALELMDQYIPLKEVAEEELA